MTEMSGNEANNNNNNEQHSTQGDVLRCDAEVSKNSQSSQNISVGNQRVNPVMGEVEKTQFEKRLENQHHFMYQKSLHGLWQVKQASKTWITETSTQQHRDTVEKVSKTLGNSQCTSPCVIYGKHSQCCKVCKTFKTDIETNCRARKNNKGRLTKFLKWENGKCQEWHRNHWEISKIYMENNQGYSDDFDSCDIVGIVKLMRNNKCFHLDERKGEIKYINDIIQMRNELMHNAHFEVQPDRFKEYVERCRKIMDLLVDKHADTSEKERVKKCKEDFNKVVELQCEEIKRTSEVQRRWKEAEMKLFGAELDFTLSSLKNNNASQEVVAVAKNFETFLKNNKDLRSGLEKQFGELTEAIEKQHIETRKHITTEHSNTRQVISKVFEESQEKQRNESKIKEFLMKTIPRVKKPKEVVDWLYEKGHINRLEEGKMRGKPLTTSEQSVILQEIVEKTGCYQYFKESLCQLEPTAYAYLLKLEDSNKKSSSSEEVNNFLAKDPITDDLQGKIRRKVYSHIENNNIRKVISKLHIKDVVNECEFDDITAQVTDEDKAKDLFQRVLDGDIEGLQTYFRALRKFDPNTANLLYPVLRQERIIRDKREHTLPDRTQEDLTDILDNEDIMCIVRNNNIISTERGCLRINVKVKSWDDAMALQKDVNSYAINGRIVAIMKKKNPKFSEKDVDICVHLERNFQEENVLELGQLKGPVRFVNCKKMGAWYWSYDSERWLHVSHTTWKYGEDSRKRLQDNDLETLERLMFKIYSKDESCSCIICSVRETCGSSHVSDEVDSDVCLTVVASVYETGEATAKKQLQNEASLDQDEPLQKASDKKEFAASKSSGGESVESTEPPSPDTILTDRLREGGLYIYLTTDSAEYVPELPPKPDKGDRNEKCDVPKKLMEYPKSFDENIVGDEQNGTGTNDYEYTDASSIAPQQNTSNFTGYPHKKREHDQDQDPDAAAEPPPSTGQETPNNADEQAVNCDILNCNQKAATMCLRCNQDGKFLCRVHSADHDVMYASDGTNGSSNMHTAKDITVLKAEALERLGQDLKTCEDELHKLFEIKLQYEAWQKEIRDKIEKVKTTNEINRLLLKDEIQRYSNIPKYSDDPTHRSAFSQARFKFHTIPGKTKFSWPYEMTEGLDSRTRMMHTTGSDDSRLHVAGQQEVVRDRKYETTLPGSRQGHSSVVLQRISFFESMFPASNGSSEKKWRLDRATSVISESEC